MKYVGHTGAKCPVDVKRSMIEWWGPVFFDAYGASEVGTTCVINSEEWLAHPGSVGRAVPPFTALILDEDGKPLPPNTEGRLYFKDATGRGRRLSQRSGKIESGSRCARHVHAR